MGFTRTVETTARGSKEEQPLRNISKKNRSVTDSL